MEDKSMFRRFISMLLVAATLAGCATRKDYMGACYDDVGCADRMASEKNNTTAKKVAVGVLVVGVVALAAVAGASAARSGGGSYVPPPNPRYGNYGCGSHGGPGWRRADGKCASWQD